MTSADGSSSDVRSERHGERERRYHVDGELLPASEATVSVRDRGFAYGDAASETLRAYGGSVFAWEEHAERLETTCDRLEIDHGIERDEFARRIDETLAANALSDALVDLSVTRGVQSGGLTPDPVDDPTVVVTVEPTPRGGRASNRTWDDPATLQTVKTRRTPERAVPARIRTHNRLNELLARLELRVTDADEALVLDADGFVTGGADSSLFFVSETALCTPSLDGPVRPGVVRGVVTDIAREEGIPVHEGRYTPDDVRGASEVFVTNTRWELRPVTTVDGIDCGGGPVTTLLSRLFDERVERYHYGRGSEGDADEGAGDASGVDQHWDVGGR